MRGNLGVFNIQMYERFLKFLKSRYRIIPFCRFSEKRDSFLILRHDVEVSLEAACQMAKVEKALGITSTYLVYLANRFYNLFEAKDLRLVNEISKMGNEIGLHFDVAQYKTYGRPMRRRLVTELHVLEELTHRKVRSFAMHNRSLYKYDPFARIPSYVNAYSFNKDHGVFYVSDSCRAWRIRDVQRLITQYPPKVQLLIHAFQWIPSARNRYVLLDKWFKEFDHGNDEYKRQWKSLWRRIKYIAEYDAAIKRSRRMLDFQYD